MESENNNNNNENNINTNDFYHEDNSFNENGISTGSNDNSSQFPTANKGNTMQNLGGNFGSGTKNNNPAFGVNGGKNNNPIKGQKPKNKNGSKPSNNNNPAKGQKDSNKRKNPLPGGINKDKKDNNNKNTNKPNQNDKNKEKNKGFGSKLNPLNRGGIGSKLGLGKKKNEKSNNNAAAPNLNQAAKKGLKLAWTAAPIQIKILIVALSLAPIIIILVLILFLALFGGTAAAVTVAMCGQEGTSGSSYNGEDYSGSSNVKEFMCKMQNPLVNPSLYVNYDNFGQNRGDHIHAGIDLASYGYKNIPIYAAQAGTVIAAGYNGGMGNHVKIKHGNSGIETTYMHMVTGSLKVKKGDKVGKGQLLGKMGTTGNSTGVHLHFEIRLNGKAQNPGPYFKKDFKNNCGSSWDGEPAGDSAKQANDTSGVEDISSDNGDTSSNEECCISGESSSSSTPVKGLPKILTQEFVDGAISTQTKYKVPASLTLAQIVLESAGDEPGNLSGLAYHCKNLFGIKGKGSAGSCTYNTNEQTSSGSDYTVSASFRKYNSYKESIEDHGKFFIENSRYSTCFNKKTGDEWAKCVKLAGYATDVDYAEKLISIMKTYNLYKYDEYTSSDTCSVGGDSFDGKIYKFYQTDYPQKFCGNQTISHSGCGPTSMAVVVSSLLKENHDPVELSKFACDNGYCGKTEGQGCYATLFEAAAKKYGLNYSTISVSNKEEIMSKLNGGKTMFIALMIPTDTPFSITAPHFIVIYGTDGDGKVSIWDPYESHGVNDKTWDFDKYFNSNNVNGMYMFSKK